MANTPTIEVKGYLTQVADALGPLKDVEARTWPADGSFVVNLTDERQIWAAYDEDTDTVLVNIDDPDEQGLELLVWEQLKLELPCEMWLIDGDTSERVAERPALVPSTRS